MLESISQKIVATCSPHLSPSNHTCCIYCGNNCLSRLNSHTCPEFNSKANILVVLFNFNNIGYSNTLSLNDTPVKVMPKVSAQIQGKGVMDTLQYNVLNAVIRYMREWYMPLLYTSCIGSDVQRSKRIQKNKVVKLK